MSEILAARNFSVAYGESPVVRAVSFSVAPGEIVAVLGRNGMGKTTLLRGIVGLASMRGGHLEVAGRNVIALAPEVIVRSGIGYVPAGRGIFSSLSVRENLIMSARGAHECVGPTTHGTFVQHLAGHVRAIIIRRFGLFSLSRRAQVCEDADVATAQAQGQAQGQAQDHPFAEYTGEAWTLDRVLTLFPRLAERIDHGGQNLSGGEQQMLAIGRALMTNPRLLLIDEATEGLAPLIAREIWRTLEDICRSGVAAIIVDRDVRRLAKIAERVIVLFKGEIVFDGRPDRLLRDDMLVQRYIGL